MGQAKYICAPHMDCFTASGPPVVEIFGEPLGEVLASLWE